MHHWIVVEAELSEPMREAVLEGADLRVRGAVERGDPATEEGIARSHEPTDVDSRTEEYVVTGTVLEASDFESESGRRFAARRDRRDPDCEWLPDPGTTDGWARDFTHG